MSDHAGLLVAAAHMREHHGPGHQRHEMWAAIAAWLEHDAEACGLNRSPFVDETHDLAHQVALTYLTDRATPDYGLRPDERLMLARAVYSLTGYPPPKGEYDLSSVPNEVERMVERIIAARVTQPGSDGGVS